MEKIGLKKQTESKTYVLLTVDTETDILSGRVIPISKMVYGEVDGKYFGINKIMDICDEYNCKATFFVSTFESKKIGEDGMRKVCQQIYKMGHDVQLHTHPKWITNERFMWNHSLEKQKDMLRYGKEMINKWIGEDPIAHRAGGFGSDHCTLLALKSLDIPIDSSYFGSTYCKLDKFKFKKNSVQVSEEGMIELPVTQFVQFKLGKFQPVKPFDINANTLSEMKFVIKAAKEKNVKVITLLMHSFSFLNRDKERIRFTPNKEDVKKFDMLLEFIDSDDDLEVITVKEFYERYKTNPQLFEGEEYLPVSGYIRTILRSFRYTKRGKGNQLIVLSVLSIISLILLLIFIFFALLPLPK